MAIHGHGNCHDESHGHDHDHDHDDHPSSTGPADNLYQHVDLQNVAILNASEETAKNKVIKPWHDRLDETVASIQL